jgi:hypothetical protein
MAVVTGTLFILSKGGKIDMADVPKNLKFLIFGRGPKWHAQAAISLELIGLICLILGIISAVTNNELGLGSGNWFLLTIALWLWGIWSWFTAYFGAKEG